MHCGLTFQLAPSVDSVGHWPSTPFPCHVDDAVVVVPAPDAGPGDWSGAASAVLVDGTFWLTLRVRRPLTKGLRSPSWSRSPTTGSPSSRSPRCGARPSAAVVRASHARPGARPGLALYLSCATSTSSAGGSTRSLHPRSTSCPPVNRQWCCPGRAGRSRTLSSSTDPRRRGVGDVVVLPPAHRARSRGPDDGPPLTSPDGLAWTDQGEVLTGRPGRWDARGARVTAVFRPTPSSTTAARRRVQLARDHRRRPLGRWCRRRPASPPTTRRSRRRTPTARSATPPRCHCRTARPVLRRGRPSRRRPRPRDRCPLKSAGPITYVASDR